ncbi:MAG: hypothetical protein SVE93_03250 [Candidatus Thermoplasmatota archaeon]|nr:hypothetical protein [Candidatus Thermoplasmatota archaeon]
MPYIRSMEYPEEVITESKKGKKEVRKLIDRGSFVRYEYIDPDTGERGESKIKLVLKGKTVEEYFIIPVKGGRSLMLKAEEKGARKIWDGEKAVDLFE